LSIILVDYNSASVTHSAVKLVCVAKFTHSWVEWILPLLTCNLSSKFRFTADAWLPVYSTHCVGFVVVCARKYVRVYCTL